MDQSTNTVVMIRPIIFGSNEQTAVNNYFQQSDSLGIDRASEVAMREFDGFVAKLRSHGVNVVVWQDNPEPYTPDAIFPNNWVSFHENNAVYLYPMFAPNRRLERLHDLKDRLALEGYEISEIHDLSKFENDGAYLEGTGSMVLDRVNKVAYAALSERTSLLVLKNWARISGFEFVAFNAFHNANSQRLPIYHTNVMMSICSDVAVVCLDSIDDLNERTRVKESLGRFREVLELTENQIEEFAGNMLELKNNKGKKLLVMSQRAYQSLLPEQLTVLNRHVEIVSSPLDTIEKLGGGSARCMIAEVFLTSK